MKNLYIDIEEFAGGGGATTGRRMATGRSVDVAVNHSPEAIAMHAINHPETLHFCQDVWQIDPLELLELIASIKGIDVMMRVAIASGWFSPDCKHFSKAKGGALVDKRIRGLAYIILKWCGRGRRAAGGLRGPACPLVLHMENVEEFKTWGPLVAKRCPKTGRVMRREVRWKSGRIRCAKGSVARRGQRVPYEHQWLVPDAKRAGLYFKRFVRALEAFGGVVEWRELRACDYGAPTIRKRLYITARFDGAPVVWPAATHGAPDSPAVVAGQLSPWKTAAECINFGLPCASIFLTTKQARKVKANRPLAPATMARIAEGVRRYVLEAAEPFIVNLTHQGNHRVEAIHGPLHTVTGAKRGEKALVAPTLVHTAHGTADKVGKKRGRGALPVTEPMQTATASPDLAVASATLAPFVSYAQHGGAVRPADAPLHTVAASDKDQNQLVVPVLVGCGGRAGQSRPRGGDEPLAAVTAKADTCLAAVHLTKFSENSTGHMPSEPMHAVMPGAPRHGVVAAFLAQHNTGVIGHDAREPVSAVTQTAAQQAVVGASLVVFYGSEADGQGVTTPLRTVTVKERFGLTQTEGMIPPLTPAMVKSARRVAAFLRAHGVAIAGEFATVGEFVIVDIGMRMLTPRELYRAQGFPEDYIIDRGIKQVDGRSVVVPLTKTEQIQMCGNAVCPPVAAALIAANRPRLRDVEVAA